MDLLIFALILLGIIVLIMFLQFINAQRDDKRYLERLNREFGSTDISSYDMDRLRFADAYFIRHRDNDDIDDITWSDLSMDEIFALMDRTESLAGREILYHFLRTPLKNPADIDKRRELIRYFRDNSQIRSKLLLYLHHAGRPLKASVYDLINELRDLKTPGFISYYVRIGLLALSVASMFIWQGMGTIFFVIILMSNAYVYYRDSSNIRPYLNVYDHISRLIGAASEISVYLKDADNEQLRSVREEITESVKNCRILTGTRGDNNPFSVVFNFIGMLFFSGLFKFWKTKDLILEHEKDIDRLIYLTGSIDALISLSGYFGRDNNYSVPEFTGDISSGIHIKGIYHPLVRDAVPNDIDTKGCILITGANASGKSTFLKSIALSFIYAQSFGLVCAEEYHAPVVTMRSAMSVRDDVSGGDSYYMAEIKAVKRIIDGFREDKARDLSGILHVCFVDELLNGTNTEERIAACTQILKSMEREGIMVFAATHDIELTVLLEKTFANYHFEEDMSDGDVRFSYMLKKGPSTSSNAIRLLVVLGFDDEIVDQAIEMVKLHQREGIWSESM